MLQRQIYQEPVAADEVGQSLTPQYFYGVFKRRVLYFLIPFLLVFTIGSLGTALWPARYLAQGTILVQSQEIPSDLVRPTIAALANDRIQVIEQRIMTRDNLLGIAKKYRLTTGLLERMSGTELVDFIRKRTIIQPAEQKLENKRQPQKQQSIAFTVGFEYEKPDIATKVANELVTMILNEDVRLRTEFAAETSRFIGQEVTRLETRLASIDAQIVALKSSQAATSTSPADDAKDLATLKAQLLFKSATYSDTHPDIVALKRKIAVLEKLIAKNPPAPVNAASSDAAPLGSATTPGIDTLESQRDSLKDELSKATQKLSAARLGESLERGQHSERLEVIEQPSLPDKPISPNRPKIFAVVCFLALMSGGGAAFGAEFLNQTVRRSTDLSALIDSHLIVAIPYITTHAEVQRKKTRKVVSIGLLVAAVILGLIIVYFVLPPLDVLFEKAMSLITR